MKSLNKLIKEVFKRKVVIPIVLILIWIFLTLFYIFNYNLSLSVISYSHSKKSFNNFNTNRIYEGKKVTGEFVAKENYLGILTISFKTFNHVAYVDEDNLVLKIKEKGAKNWYYQNTYRSGSIFQVPFYPFGFPKINDSRGKTYQFELESINGNNINAVALNSWEPVLVTRYQVPKAYLLENKANLIHFFGRKIFVAFGNQEVIFFSFIYLLPFLFYLILFTSPFKKIFLPKLHIYERKLTDLFERTIVLREILFLLRVIKKIFKSHLDMLLITIVLTNIFLIPALNDIALIVITTLWLYVSTLYKRSSKASFTIGILLLAFCPLILLFNLENTAEKSSVWAYMFFLAGTIQIFRENK